MKSPPAPPLPAVALSHAVIEPVSCVHNPTSCCCSSESEKMQSSCFIVQLLCAPEMDNNYWSKACTAFGTRPVSEQMTASTAGTTIAVRKFPLFFFPFFYLPIATLRAAAQVAALILITVDIFLDCYPVQWSLSCALDDESRQDANVETVRLILPDCVREQPCGSCVDCHGHQDVRFSLSKQSHRRICI